MSDLLRRRIHRRPLPNFTYAPLSMYHLRRRPRIIRRMSSMSVTSKVLIFVCSGLLLWVFYSVQGLAMITPIPRGPSWQDIATEKRQHTLDKIPTEWILPLDKLEAAKHQRSIAGEFLDTLLDTESRRITNMDGLEIVKSTSTGTLTVVQVVTAFAKRASYAHQLNNNLLDINVKAALSRARELDRYWEKHQKPIGPLHGLPFTMKDQFHIEGLETTMGYVGWIGTFEGQKGTGKEGKFDSEVVRELVRLGAIPLAKTTLIQSLWGPETDNNILGYLWNPLNQRLSPGGSSGGEGALQAMRGSAFGFGSDVGGSVTMPAAFSGVYGFKPSHGRTSMKGAAGSGKGQVVIPTIAGMLGPQLSTLHLVFKSLLSTEPWLYDPDVLPIPYRSEAEYGPDQKASFAIYDSDGIVAPHPPIARALRMVADALKAESHRIIKWDPPSIVESQQIHGPIARGDMCPDVYYALALSGEPPIPLIKSLFPKGELQPPIPLTKFENVTLHMKDFRERYLDYWMSTSTLTETGRPVDVVIAPVATSAGLIPGKFMHSPYSSVINVLDYPTVVIPVTFADKNIDTFDKDYKPLNDLDKKSWESYDPEIYDGGPAAIQIYAKNLEEEKLLSIAQIVVDALKKQANKSKL